MKPALTILASLLALAARAHLGDPITECDQRYGGGKQGRPSAADLIKPMVTGTGATNLTYLYQGFTIRIGFEKSVATHMDYTKMGSAKLSPEEIQGILDANAGDSDWRQLSRYDYEMGWPGMAELAKAADSGRIWMRRDYSVAYLYSLSRSMRLILKATHRPEPGQGSRTKPSGRGTTTPGGVKQF